MNCTHQKLGVRTHVMFKLKCNDKNNNVMHLSSHVMQSWFFVAEVGQVKFHTSYARGAQTCTQLSQ